MKAHCTHTAYLPYKDMEGKQKQLSFYDCFSVPRWDELLLFTIDSLRYGTFQYCKSQGDRLSVTNGIKASIPPFMTIALMGAVRANQKFCVWRRLKPSGTSWGMKPTTKRLHMLMSLIYMVICGLDEECC